MHLALTQPQLSPHHLAHARHVDVGLPALPLVLGPLAGRLALEYDAVLLGLPPAPRLARRPRGLDAPPHAHGHALLREDALLGPELLQAQVRRPGAHAARREGRLLLRGRVRRLVARGRREGVGGAEDVGLRDEPLQGEVVRQELGRVFVLGVVVVVWAGGGASAGLLGLGRGAGGGGVCGRVWRARGEVGAHLALGHHCGRWEGGCGGGCVVYDLDCFAFAIVWRW